MRRWKLFMPLLGLVLLGAPVAVWSAEKLDDLKTLSEITGKPGAVTGGGEIQAMDSNIPFLLWTKAGGAKTLSALAGDLCKEVGSEKLRSLLLVPADYQEQYSLATAYGIQLQELEKESKAMVERLGLAEPKRQTDADKGQLQPMWAVEAVGGLIMAEFIIGAVSNIVKSVNPDRKLAARHEDRSALFRILARNNPDCNAVVTVMDLGAIPRSLIHDRFTELHGRVIRLRTAYEMWAAEKNRAESKAEAEQKKQPKEETAANRLKAVMAFSGLGATLKEFISRSNADMLMLVAAATALKEHTNGKPLLLTRLEAEELQIQKEGAWSKGLLRSATATVEYHLLDADGRLLTSGYLARSSAEEEKKWDKPWTASAKR